MQQDFDREVLSRLPLAEAVLSLWQSAGEDEHLDALSDRHRGGSYQKKITFPLMVHLVRDALLEPDGSGHQSFRHAQQDGILTTALSSIYDKLGHLPAAVTSAAAVRKKLGRLLGAVWSECWVKAKPKECKPPTPKKGKRDHTSIFRLLQIHRKMKETPNST